MNQIDEQKLSFVLRHYRPGMFDTQKAWTFTVKNRTTGETVTFGINGPTVNQNPIRQEGNNQTFIDLASYKALAEKESLKFAGFSASGVSRTIDRLIRHHISDRHIGEPSTKNELIEVLYFLITGVRIYLVNYRV